MSRCLSIRRFATSTSASARIAKSSKPTRSASRGTTDDVSKQLFTQRLTPAPGERFPSILSTNPILDAWTSSEDDAAKFGLQNVFDDGGPSIKFFNNPAPFPNMSDRVEREAKPRPEIGPREKHMYVLLKKRVVHQSGKGKIGSQYAGVVVGNGKGIVGFGDAKSDQFAAAMAKAEQNAVKNCDFVDMFEGRTIWTDMSIKFGSTKLILRPRPRGFGLMCNPYVHQVCKAAGIKDISAKVHGSRNPMAIIKATLMLLHPGGAPLAMGDGLGGRLRREYKKQGIKSQATMERERGRAFVEGGSWI